MSSRPRVLFLTCHAPFAPQSGGRRREHELLTRLSERFEIDVCAVTTSFESDRARLPAASGSCRRVWLHAAADAVSGDGAPQVERHASDTAHAALARLAGRDADYELVHVEGFYLMQHIPAGCQLPVLLVEPNIEHLLLRRRAIVAEHDGARRELERAAEATHRAERVAWLRASTCATMTEDDRRAMLADMPSLEVSVIPDGVDDGSTLTGWEEAAERLAASYVSLSESPLVRVA